MISVISQELVVKLYLYFAPTRQLVCLSDQPRKTVSENNGNMMLTVFSKYCQHHIPVVYGTYVPLVNIESKLRAPEPIMDQGPKRAGYIIVLKFDWLIAFVVLVVIG